jgi:hypothetical protein
MFVTTQRSSSKFILCPTVLSLLHKIAVPPKIFINDKGLCQLHVMTVVAHHDEHARGHFALNSPIIESQSHIMA